MVPAALVAVHGPNAGIKLVSMEGSAPSSPVRYILKEASETENPGAGVDFASKQPFVHRNEEYSAFVITNPPPLGLTAEVVLRQLPEETVGICEIGNLTTQLADKLIQAMDDPESPFFGQFIYETPESAQQAIQGGQVVQQGNQYRTLLIYRNTKIGEDKYKESDLYAQQVRAARANR
jgi:hypothetical protein